MITALGPSVATTVAAIRAGKSAYAISEYKTEDGKPITMARIPDAVFNLIDAEIDEGDRFNLRYDRITKMAILAAREACSQKIAEQSVPIVLGVSDRPMDQEGLGSLLENLQENCKPWISTQLSRSLHSGRVAGIEAIDFAFNYLYELDYPYVLIGASDSFLDDYVITPLANEYRLLTAGASNAFAPGEAASCLLLTRYPQFAELRQGYGIALCRPGMAHEEGHLYSSAPYKGEGLDQAFKQALNNQPRQSIQSIYSSMNGENHWAKEYGVAYLRNKEKFIEHVKIEHPADCYGDLGVATGTTLIAIAAEDLHKDRNAKKHLVYSSSDFGKRGAIVVEKVEIANGKELKV